MGRKIPGKKHRSIVDPEKQREKRLESLKNKINNPPSNEDEQEVPRSVLEIIELKKQAISGGEKGINGTRHSRGKDKWKKRKKSKLLSLEKFLDNEKEQVGLNKPEQFIPKIKQMPNETPEHFLYRVNMMTEKIIQESKFEDKFHVSIKKDPDTGKILKIEKVQTKLKKKNSRKKSLAEKRKEKKIKKAAERQAKDFSHLKDIVEFGEVVHRPPSNLPAVKNKAKGSELNNKERYKNLLLKDLIVNKSNKSSEQKLQLEKQENQRKFIVNAYRERKKQLRLRKPNSALVDRKKCDL